MFKKLLNRFFSHAPGPLEPEDDAALNPLTVFAMEPPAPVEMIDVDNLFFPWLLGMGAAVAEDMDEAENRLLRTLKRIADSDDPATADLVPRIPSVIPMLLRSLRDRNVSNSRLAEQVAQDAVLVAAVLKQVNSSYFRRSTPVKTIEDAIAVIGQNGLRMLVAGVAFKPLFNAGLGHFTAEGAPRMWELADSYGIACRYFSKSRHVDGFEAFLAGLLQNVGAIVALRVLDQAGGAGPGELRSLDFQASFAHYARRLARVVGTHWEFPSQAIAAVDRPPVSELGEVVRLADRICKVHVLVKHGRLRPDHADACLEGDEAAACYKEILAAEAAQEKSAA
jgi:HD-like signal output (HDOD) protein